MPYSKWFLLQSQALQTLFRFWLIYFSFLCLWQLPFGQNSISFNLPFVWW